MSADFDLAIVGAGFGGAMLAMVGRRLGLRVALLERGRHPRFAIGESASPLAGILIEQLAARYDLPRLLPLANYGTWQRAYPEVVCGLKRGFTFFRQDEGRPYRRAADRAGELLVAASPCDALSDTHWLRADVDYFLVREAVALGAEYADMVTLHGLTREAGAAVLTGDRAGRPLRVRARVVVDASGPRGFLSRVMGIPDRGFDGYPATQALFTHFTGVPRCDEMDDYSGPPDAGGEPPPYPIDDAAVHHVFDGGWMWVLRFGNGVTSAGVAVTDALAADLRLADGEPAWHRLLARYPSIRAQFAHAEPTRPFTWLPRLAWRAASAAGEGWAMLPSAAAFVDPLFSTGIPLTLIGVERIARMLEGGFAAGAGRDARAAAGAAAASEYSAATLAEADRAAAFVGGCYASFARFPVFVAYSMFYFAAASFTELARRLDAPGRPQRFLCADHPEFGPATLLLSPARGIAGDDASYARAVAGAVECLNVAGLCRPERRNWYPVDVEDAVRGASKLGVAPEAVRAAWEQALASVA